MEVRMSGKPRLNALAVWLGGLAISVTAVASVLAQNDVFGPSVAVKDTGMFGLTMGRVARIDAVNLGGRPGDVHLELLDDAGKMLADKLLMLEPGQAGSVEFMSDQKGRMNIRAHTSVRAHTQDSMRRKHGP